MAIKTETMDGRTICKFSGDLNIWEATDLWRQLQPLLAASQPLTLDLDQVKGCDAAGLQILCQVRRAARHQGRQIRITAVSETVQTALALAGLDMMPLFQPPKEV